MSTSSNKHGTGVSNEEAKSGQSKEVVEEGSVKTVRRRVCIKHVHRHDPHESRVTELVFECHVSQHVTELCV